MLNFLIIILFDRPNMKPVTDNLTPSEAFKCHIPGFLLVSSQRHTAKMNEHGHVNELLDLSTGDLN